MFAHTFLSSRNSSLSLTMIMPCYHLISFIRSPSAHSPVIISPLQLIPQLTPLLLLPPTSHHCGPVSLGSRTWWNENCFQQLFFHPLRLCSLLHSPLLPFRKPQQLLELFIKLVKSSSPWQIMTLLGGSTLSKPNVCLHKKYRVHNLKGVKVSPGLQNTDLIWILPTHLSMLLW